MIWGEDPVIEIGRRNVQYHGQPNHHAWLWLIDNEDTIYWIDPTWTDGSGYVWWGVVRNGREEQMQPLASLCLIQPPRGQAFALFNNANANRMEGNWNNAIAEYNQVLSLDPNYVPALNNRGRAFYNKGELELAQADFNRAIQLAPRDPLGYCNRAAVYSEQGELDRAIADYTQALRLDPAYTNALNGRGDAYFNKGDMRRAEADYDASLRINPYNRNVQSALRASRGEMGL
jgi:tetratricopeptide (TPR) repeat protein